MSDPISPARVDMTHEHAVQSMASERYLLDEMSDDEREAFEAHYFSCAACAEDLRMASLIRDEFASVTPARGAQTPSARPEAGVVVRPARWSKAGRSVILPWAVAASLAAVVGYQSIATNASWRDTLDPQAVSPTVLRGVTRGAAPVVTIAEDQAIVALSLDAFTDGATRQLSFDLLGPAGNALLSGRASVPPSGVPLLLLVPSDRFTGPGQHTLIVRDADRPELIIGDYAFVVSR